ncbi:hypothetical protein IB223_16310 [Pseudoxanthomonas sp. PXM03]|uniref:hypothetical protein n=1 Tax=Pseudoxanthomonas sp. PXM03 TaxID=2769284 RepID=UPI0017802BE8|nr:hypothetical protein [Pseudoxanthomonas sp. PXM03]MBD9437661.1 hypothetical protein [Pseudoxanthomonas sp. PXM03]
MALSPEQLGTIFPYFIAFWVAVALAALAFFHFNKNGPLKRKLFLILTIVADIALLGFIWVSGAPLPFLAVVAAFMVFGAWQAVRFTRFCGKCGANNFPQRPFQSRTECKKCGDHLAVD